MRLIANNFFYRVIFLRLLLVFSGFWVVFFWGFSGARAQLQGEAENFVSDGLVCSRMIELAERAKRIPRGLLEAIARVESGRLVPDQRLVRPWPWTVTVDGDGRFYPTREAALKALTQFQRDGKNNIDVGCMQVNMLYHGDSFKNVEEMIDPVNNVAYATELLYSLFQRHRNWDQAVRFYHSSNPEKHNNYLNRVVNAWQNIDKPVGTPLRASAEVRRLDEERLAQSRAQKSIVSKSKNKNNNPLAKENALSLKTKLFSDQLRRDLNITARSPDDKKKRDANRRQYLGNQREENRIEPGKSADFFIESVEFDF